MKFSDIIQNISESTKVTEAAGLARILDHTKEREFAIMTAFRGEYDQKQNLARNESLKSDIRSLGLGFLPIDGNYIENAGTPEEKKVSEKSFMIVNKDGSPDFLEKITELGKKYDQESVFFKPLNSEVGQLVDSSSGSIMNIGKFTPEKVGDYYSELHGKPFTFQ